MSGIIRLHRPGGQARTGISPHHLPATQNTDRIYKERDDHLDREDPENHHSRSADCHYSLHVMEGYCSRLLRVGEASDPPQPPMRRVTPKQNKENIIFITKGNFAL